MESPRRITVVILFCALLMVLPLGTTATTMTTYDGGDFVPEDIDIFQMVPDPNLDSEPDAFVNGTSGEFSYSYSTGYMQLLWTHVEGTTVDFHDSVYFTQSFDWPYEEMPERAIMNLTYSVTFTGSFLNTTNQNMFKIYAWLIDSSGNWVEIYVSEYPYSSNYIERQIYVVYSDFHDAIYGMIEDNYGVQEDPEDILSLGIGLVPTDAFQSSLDTGSVNVSTSAVSFYVTFEAEPDPETHLTPLYNQTFNTIIDDLRPGLVDPMWEIEDGVWDFLRQMTKDPEGNLYLTGECITTYSVREYAGYYETHQFLIKYSPTLNRQWLVRNDNQTRGRAITYHDGYLYTTGYFYRDAPEYYNLMLTKWSTSGEKIWEKEWSGAYDQAGVGIDVDNDGSIYVIVNNYNFRSEPAFQNTSLWKFDESGEFVWSNQPQDASRYDIPVGLWVFEDRFVLQKSSEFLSCMNLEGTWLWGAEAGAAICDENGTIYTATEDYQSVRIAKYDLEGNQTWNAHYKLEYPNGWIERFIPHGLALTPADELIVLVQCRYYDDAYFLLKYSLDGEHLQTWSIGDFTWPLPGQWSPLMEVTSTGLVYVSYHPMGRGPWTQAFAIGDYTLPQQGGNTLTIIAVGGGVAAIALIGIYVYKRKQF